MEGNGRPRADGAGGETVDGRDSGDTEAGGPGTSRGDGADGDDRSAVVAEYTDVMAAAAEGDLTVRMDPDRGDEALAELARGFNEMMDSLEETVAEVWTFSGEVGDAGSAVASSAAEIEAASQRVSTSIEDISERTDEQTRNVQSVSSEMDEISAAIEEVAASAQEVADTAQEATARGEQGQSAAEKAIDEIERVEAASDRIVDRIEELDDQMSEVDEIVEFITDIADQTNMLALNANIEAARAGGEGEGFAVVADEIKSLAEETKDAAGEIEAVLVEAQDQTERAVDDIQDTSEAISTGVTTVQEALAALTDTVDRIEEASDGIQEISEAVDDQAEANQRVLDQVNEVADIAESVNERADTVADAAGRQTRSISGISRQTEALRDRVTSLESSLTEFAVSEWGQRINDYCRRAGIDWRQFEGATLTFGMNDHPFTTTTEPLLEYFEALTGIEIEYAVLPEEELYDEVRRDLASGGGRFDGFYLGLWPCADYYDGGWIRDLTGFFEDASLTDRRWYHMEDYPDSVIDSLTYGDGVLTSLPFGIEAFGCVAYDRPTFQKLGLEEPTDFESLRHAAKTIHESDVDRDGIVSRGTGEWSSSQNWASMFRSHGAEWIDYDRRQATLDSDRGVRSLELYGELLREYGPPDVGSMNWLRANQHYGDGNAGMAYHTPSTFGVFSDEQYDRTEWVPPLEGPDGHRIVAPWTWSLGISQGSEDPGAAWLFLQWATCRPANLLASTDQWQGQEPYGWARAEWIFEQEEFDRRGLKDSWIEAHTRALDAVPSDPPAVPLHTPQNTDIMDEAGKAMHATVTGRKTAREALEEAAPAVTEYAREIPDEYLR